MLIPYLAKVGKTLDDLYAYANIEKRSDSNKNDENPRASKKHKPSPTAATSAVAAATVPMNDHTLAEIPKTTIAAVEKKIQRERIQKLTKKDIIAKLDLIGDSCYSQYWKKSELVEHLVDILTEQHYHVQTYPPSSELLLELLVPPPAATTARSPKKTSAEKHQMMKDHTESNCEEDEQSRPTSICDKHHDDDLEKLTHKPPVFRDEKVEDVVAVTERQYQKDNPLPNQVKNAVAAVEKLTIRDSTDEKNNNNNNKDVKAAHNASDDRMSVDVILTPDLLLNPANEPPVNDSVTELTSTKENQKVATGENISSSPLKQQVEQLMDGESQFFGTAQEFGSQHALMMMHDMNRNGVKKYEPTLSPTPASTLKTERSPLATVVNPGHVESAKKLFEKTTSMQHFTKPVPFTAPKKEMELPSDFSNVVAMKAVSSSSSDLSAAKPNPMRLGLAVQAVAALGTSEVGFALKSNTAQERLKKMREKSKKTGIMALPSSIPSTAATGISQSSSIRKYKFAHPSNAERINEIRKIALKKEGATAPSGHPSSHKMIYEHTRPQPTPIILSKSEDNYEMSDSGSDSDSSEASRRRATKRFPDWARRKNLIIAMEHQFSKHCQIDPDELFGEIETCDLCAIFPSSESKKRYKRRNSSGNWAEYRLTEEEKARCKQQISVTKN
jgi:hypothetical protein